jgi:hypothetical protein
MLGLGGGDGEAADLFFLRVHVGAEVVDGFDAGQGEADGRFVEEVAGDDLLRAGLPDCLLLFGAADEGADGRALLVKGGDEGAAGFAGGAGY